MLIRGLKLLTLVVSILLLAGCVETFFIKAEGTLDEDIVFQFYKLDRMTPSSKKFSIKGIDYISVDENLGDKGWKKVWELRGEAKDKLTQISYGQLYPGLQETIKANVLKKDARYRIFVSKPGVNGGGAFYFDEEDNIVIITATNQQ